VTEVVYIVGLLSFPTWRTQSGDEKCIQNFGPKNWMDEITRKTQG